MALYHGHLPSRRKKIFNCQLESLELSLDAQFFDDVLRELGFTSLEPLYFASLALCAIFLSSGEAPQSTNAPVDSMSGAS